MSISYANVAAKRQETKPESAASAAPSSAANSPVASASGLAHAASAAAAGAGSDSTSAISTSESPNTASAAVVAAAAAARPSPASDGGLSSTSGEQLAAPSASEAAAARAPEKAKKVLTPAPAPSKSVWGAAAAAQQSTVDEHKWPTPDKISEIEQSQQSANRPSTKPNKASKWVPLNAKVVLPSPRNGQNSASGQSKHKKKNKNTKKNKNASVPMAGHDGQLKESAKDSDSKEGDDKYEAAHVSDASASEQTSASIAAMSDGQLQPNSGYANDHRGRITQQQQKNHKKSQNGFVAGAAAAKAQGCLPQSQQNHQPPRQQQNNPYYQQFVPQQFQHNNRHYRPSNGSAPYSRSNSIGNYQSGGAYAAPNGFRPLASVAFVPIPQHPQPMMVAGMPYGTPIPVQVPPPISPKQNPQQALTQQIDYYFSLENLIRDVFLRRNMGTEGWVDLDLIMNFKRVKIIINGIRNAIEEADEELKEEMLDKAILTAVQQCQNLEIGYLNGKEDHDAKATEVQLRVKHSFEQWILPDN